MKNDAIKALTSPSVDLNELIEFQASQQTGTVPPVTHFNVNDKVTGQKQKRGKVYQKTIFTKPNPTKRG